MPKESGRTKTASILEGPKVGMQFRSQSRRYTHVALANRPASLWRSQRKQPMSRSRRHIALAQASDTIAFMFGYLGWRK